LNEKSFACDECPSKFSQRRDLKKHMEKKHPTTSLAMMRNKFENMVQVQSDIFKSELMEHVQEESKLVLPSTRQISGESNSKSEKLSLRYTLSQFFASKRKSVEVDAENKHHKTYHNCPTESKETFKQQESSPEIISNVSSEIERGFQNNQMSNFIIQNNQALSNNTQIPEQQPQNQHATIFSQVEESYKCASNDQALPRQHILQQFSQNVQSQLSTIENQDQMKDYKLSTNKESKSSQHRFTLR